MCLSTPNLMLPVDSQAWSRFHGGQGLSLGYHAACWLSCLLGKVGALPLCLGQKLTLPDACRSLMLHVGWGACWARRCTPLVSWAEARLACCLQVLDAMEGKTRLNQASWPSEASGSSASGLTCCSSGSAGLAVHPSPADGRAGHPLTEDQHRVNPRLGSLHDSANSRLISPQSSKNMAAAPAGPQQLSPLAPQPSPDPMAADIQLTGVQHPKWVPNHGFVSPFAAFGTPQAQLQIINESSGIVSSTDSTGTADHERRSLDPGGPPSGPPPHPPQH